MADFTQDFFTSRRNRPDGNTYVGQKDRLWYDSITNTIRIGDGTAGGKLVGGGGGGGPIALNDLTDVNTGTPGAGENNYVLAWNNASNQYVLQADTDPVFSASPAASITNTDITNWDTAFGWGDHSTVGYATLTGINLDGGAVNQVLVKQTGTDYDYAWEDLITYEPKYRVEVDDTSTVRTMYVGEAAPNSATSAAVWRIKEVKLDNKGNVDSVRWANGDNSFSYIYDNRLTYTYS